MKWLLVGMLIFCVPAQVAAYETGWGSFTEEELTELDRKKDPHRWTGTDTVLQLAFAAVLIMDWSQTLYIARNPRSHSEKNKILGEKPSEGRVNTYFTTALIGHTAVAIILPKPYRTIWQGVWIAIELKVVRDNHYEGGIKITVNL